jgi:hypothetical protein
MNWFTTEHILALTLPATLIVAAYIITVRWNQIVAFANSKNITTHTVGGFIVAAAFAYDSSPQLRDYIGTLFTGYPVVVTKIGLLAANIVGAVTLWRNYSHSSSDAGTLATARDIYASGNAPTAAEADAASTK